MRRALVLALCSLCAPALAGDLDPETVAKIRRDQKAAEKKIAEAYGNRKPSELSNQERREVAQKRAAAEQQVLEKHGVETKDYVRYTTRMDNDERAAADAAEKKLDAEAKAKKAAEAEKAKGDGEVEVQRGFDERNPVSLEGGGDEVEVIRGR